MKNDALSKDACSWESTAGFLVLRLFLALIALMNGVNKFLDRGIFSFETYASKSHKIAASITDSSFIPLWMSTSFSMPLGYVLILVGLAILLGFFSRVALVVSGLLYSGLAFGLLAAQNSPGVAWLAIYVGLTVMGLNLAKHNRFEINRL